MKKIFVLSVFFLGISWNTFAYNAEDVWYAEQLTNQNIITQQSTSDRYRLDDKITRAEIIGIALKIKWINFSDDYKCKKYFSDTIKNDWSCRALELAVDNGVITKTNRNGRPQDTVTKYESLAIILKALNIDYERNVKTYENTYYKVTRPQWQQDIDYLLSDKGINFLWNNIFPSRWELFRIIVLLESWITRGNIHTLTSEGSGDTVYIYHNKQELTNFKLTDELMDNSYIYSVQGNKIFLVSISGWKNANFFINGEAQSLYQIDVLTGEVTSIFVNKLFNFALSWKMLIYDDGNGGYNIQNLSDWKITLLKPQTPITCNNEKWLTVTDKGNYQLSPRWNKMTLSVVCGKKIPENLGYDYAYSRDRIFDYSIDLSTGGVSFIKAYAPSQYHK